VPTSRVPLSVVDCQLRRTHRYLIIFRIKYFDFLNAMTIFIVLAIGADDIFVFLDAYRQSAFAGEHVLRGEAGGAVVTHSSVMLLLVIGEQTWRLA
jgi:hypothetical protein